MTTNIDNNNQRIISYVITGIDKSGKRFKIESANYHYIAYINVWKGTLWGIKGNKKRKRLRIYNN